MGERLSTLQRNRIHRALSRPNLLMRADRELLLVTGLVAIILIFVSDAFWPIIFDSVANLVMLSNGGKTREYDKPSFA